jgi:DNA-binding NarL/FixJ family response regulator
MSRLAGRAHNGAMPSPLPTQIFIVDDSAAIRQRLAEMLGALAGVRVVGEAGAVRPAIEGILRTRPDLVLLDLALGRESGIEVLRAVRANAPAIAFVVLSNHGEAQYRRACARAGAARFLDKSSEFQQVPAVIAELASTSLRENHPS